MKATEMEVERSICQSMRVVLAKWECDGMLGAMNQPMRQDDLESQGCFIYKSVREHQPG